jgi:hypothetical protein
MFIEIIVHQTCSLELSIPTTFHFYPLKISLILLNIDMILIQMDSLPEKIADFYSLIFH